jgi:hypothetical protein
MNSFEMSQIHMKGQQVIRRRVTVTEDANGYRLHRWDDGTYDDKRYKTFAAAVHDGIAFCLNAKPLEPHPTEALGGSLTAERGAFASGDVIALGTRTVRVSGMPDGTLCRDGRKRVAVRNVATNRLSYIPERRLIAATHTPQPPPDTEACLSNVEDAIDAYWGKSAPEVQEHAPARSEDGQGPSEADTQETEAGRCL